MRWRRQRDFETWYPGQAGGEAAADILFGRFNPCGKLPVTFYHSADDLPDFRDYAMKNRTYRYFVGKALYPFGFGLSYTAFAFENARFEGDTVFVTVRNTGKRQGAETAQVYIRAEEAPDAPENPVLCASGARTGRARRRSSRSPCRRRVPGVNADGDRASEGQIYAYVGGASRRAQRASDRHASREIAVTKA